MKIVFVSSEMAPYAKTGGLADVVGSLPWELNELGHDTAVILPRYKTVRLSPSAYRTIVEDLEVPIGAEKRYAQVHLVRHRQKLPVYLIHHDEFFGRDELYGTPRGDYPDNDRRFVFFQRASLELLKAINFKPDILHAHDWQTGLMPVYLKTLYQAEPFFKKTKTFFTIHNLAYQGNFPPDTLPTTGLGWEEFTMDRLEFYGKLSFLKGGIVYSDRVTTVSQRYAEEIQTQEFGCGLEGVLRLRAGDLSGIVNGIDVTEWNPETDPDLPSNYSLATLEKKAENKRVLQEENRIERNPEVPLFGMVSRLADQKGLDILAPAMETLAKEGVQAQFVILGTGQEKYHNILRDLGKKYPKEFGINIRFDAALAKRIYAGADFFLMPSHYEPCGLGQLIAMRYGTVPLVRETGGLADTVREFNRGTKEGNGIVFKEYTEKALIDALKRAIEIFKDKKAWSAVVKNGMTSDFSWTASAKKYAELYKQAERKTGVRPL